MADVITVNKDLQFNNCSIQYFGSTLKLLCKHSISWGTTLSKAAGFFSLTSARMEEMFSNLQIGKY